MNVEQKQTRHGVVTSAKMDKTVVVETQRLTRHPLYERVLRRTTKFKAHDEANECNEGDEVEIEECRPISRTKSWRVIDILKRAE